MKIRKSRGSSLRRTAPSGGLKPSKPGFLGRKGKKVKDTKARDKKAKDLTAFSQETKEEIKDRLKELEEEKKSEETKEPKTPEEKEKQEKLKEIEKKIDEVREKLKDAIKSGDYETAKESMKDLQDLSAERNNIMQTPAAPSTPAPGPVPAGGGGGVAPAGGGGGAAPAYGGGGGAAPGGGAAAPASTAPAAAGNAPVSTIKPDGSGQDAVDLARKYRGQASIACKGKLPTFKAAGGTGNNCADFVGACLEATGRFKGTHSASVKILEGQLKSQGYVLVPANQARPGDVWMSGSRGHTELVSENGPGGMKTIGSNGGATNQVISERGKSGGVVYQLQEKK
ncbi:MAG: hypothetical protein K8T10_12045 [Candidatus Eremiobacteraeota bacterium]|nr:hypothetical protein [Candidatus Eremiobacteraeota bacterium]